MKKRFGTFICLCLVLAVLLAPRAFAAEIIDSGYCGGEGDGTNLTWTLDDEGTLIISGEGAMADSWDHGSLWHERDADIRSVLVLDGVTIIGELAFAGCNTQTVSIPNSVTNICDSAFYCCTELTSIIIPDSVVSIGESAFSDCWALSEVTLPAGIKQVEAYTFYYCTSLQTVILPEGIATIKENAFGACRNLTTVSLPNTVTTIGSYAFSGCNFSTITLPQQLSHLGECALSGSPSLTEISVSDKNEYYTVINNCLYNKDLTEIILFPAGTADFSSWYLPTVTAIGAGAFSGCEHMERFSIPQSITHIGDSAFAGCRGISSFEIPEGVVSIGDGAFASSDLINISLPDSLISIGANAFDSCWRMSAIVIPPNVQDIGQAVFLFDYIESVIFEGDAPTFNKNAFSASGEFFAYYPADNPTWTEDKLQDYDGDITWVPYDEEMLYHTRLSLETLPRDEFNLKIIVTRLGASADDLVMIALYSPDGKYLETVLWELSNDTAQTYTLSRDNSDGEIGRVKVFIVDALSNPVPLSETAEIQ